MPAPFIAVDWGTSNRRAYRIGADGGVEARFADGQGVTDVPPGGFPAAADAIRAALGPGPMLMAGMVGSDRGWAQVDYVAAPAGIAEIAAGVRRVADGAMIVPGVRSAPGARPDVMRGEEVQAMGAVAAGMLPPDALLCHPGTHAKWITLASGRIVDFRTAVTGEMFALLRERSLLAAMLDGASVPGAAFADGVDEAARGTPLVRALFEVRAAVLLGALDRADAASRVSGLLIGADACAAVAEDPRPVALMGAPALVALYGAALDRLGRTWFEVADEEAFVNGMTAIAGAAGL